jgi:NAD(P)H-nitrite reductase large subunit
MEKLVIIGNGIAGITVARNVRKNSDMDITIISSETEHFFSRTALMYIYMGHMKFEHTKPYEDWFWSKNHLKIVKAHVTSIDIDSRRVRLENGQSIEYDKLVIATGSKSNKFGWPGQDLKGVQGLYSKPDLDLMEENTNNISCSVVVGGGLIGIEMAEMLLSRKIPVTFLVRENFYWDNVLPNEEAQLISRHIQEHGIDLRLATELKEILPDGDGRVRSVITNKGEEISCQFVGLTAGVYPNTDVVRNSPIEINRGVLVNEFLETNVPQVYAAGDCVEFRTVKPRHPKIEQLWYTGRMQGETLAKTICGERTAYDRGIWFNSAKFFDIEYQTYGFVNNIPIEGEASLYWEHTDGRHAIRIVFSSEDHSVIGFNLLGIRFRQNVCQRWIRERRSIHYVMENLSQANFDPEFFESYEKDVVDTYERQYPGNRVKLSSGRRVSPLSV